MVYQHFFGRLEIIFIPPLVSDRLPYWYAVGCFLKAQNAENAIAVAAWPRTPLGSLQRSPDLLAGFKGIYTSKMRGSQEGRERGQWGSEGKGHIWVRDFFFSTSSRAYNEARQGLISSCQ